jgi:hypothetical protein
MPNERKKTAAKNTSTGGVRKPNPAAGRLKKMNKPGKGTRSQVNTERKAGVSSTGAKKLMGKSGKRKSPLKAK